MSDSDLHHPYELRSQADRRQRPTPAIGSYLLRGRRRAARRDSDFPKGYYVDHPGRRAVLVVIAVLLLCALDGVLTLRLIEQGAREANPVMDFFLSLGTPVFLSVKYGATLLALAVLLIHKNFTVFGTPVRVKWIVAAFLAIYAALVLYEITLLVVTV